ncbi:MAG: FAD-binding oxidoreductase [Limnobacter sp.]|nr:FAD-binding oxidoreductase [Limnobacter sp.]
MPHHPASAELARFLATNELHTDPAFIALACTDWRKRYHTQALAVVRPHSVQMLCKLVQWCAHHQIPLTTQGGNTGLVGGAVPALSLYQQRPHVVLQTTALRDPIQIDEANLTLTASAGYTLQEIQQAAESRGYLFPLSLASEGSCTLGGNLASNAGGVAVLRYGNTRELCLGLEFVNAKGELCGDLRGLRKNNTGYDLRHLLIGSEGTLGIITKACMKIFPQPTARVLAWVNLPSISSAVGLLKATQSRLFNELSSFEWMNAHALAVVKRQFDLPHPGEQTHAGCDHVLMEFTALCPQESLQAQVENTLADLLENPAEELQVLDIFIARNLQEAQQFWALRENISEAQSREGLNIKHDIACKVSALPEFHSAVQSHLQQQFPGIQPVLFGHLGDGNLHYTWPLPKIRIPPLTLPPIRKPYIRWCIGKCWLHKAPCLPNMV